MLPCNFHQPLFIFICKLSPPSFHACHLLGCLSYKHTHAITNKSRKDKQRRTLALLVGNGVKLSSQPIHFGA